MTNRDLSRPVKIAPGIDGFWYGVYVDEQGPFEVYLVKKGLCPKCGYLVCQCNAPQPVCMRCKSPHHHVSDCDFGA